MRVMEIKSEVVITPLFNTGSSKIRAESDIYVENFIKILYILFSGGGTIEVVKTDGESFQFPGYSKCSGGSGWVCSLWVLYVNAPEGNDKFGVVVGASSETEDLRNYNLIAKYPHGTETNQVYYGSSEIEEYWDEENKRHVIRIRRWFENKSPSDIVINEVGLIADWNTCCAYTWSGWHEKCPEIYILLSRTVLPTSFTLPVGRMMYIDYFIYLHF